jgi:hypothetical protein
VAADELQRPEPRQGVGRRHGPVVRLLAV